MMTEMTAPEIIDLVREYGAYRVIVAQARSDYEADADTKS